MLVFHGERLYGKVDRVPGLLYVSTLFFYLQYLPIVPLRSYIIIEGTENGSAFRGKQVRLRLKSVLAGYLRPWLGAVAVIVLPIAAYQLTHRSISEREPLRDLASFAMALAAFVGVAYVLAAKTWLFLYMQTALHGASVSAWLAVAWGIMHLAPHRGGRGDGSLWEMLLFGNVALLVFTLTRLLSYTSRDNALTMAEAMGLDRDAITPIIDQIYGAGSDLALNQMPMEQAKF